MNKPYPKYKPSGVEWLGDVPEHWGVKKLKFIGTALIGLTYSPDEVVDEEYEGEKHLVLRSTNIQDGKISLHENVYVTTQVSKKLEVRKNDILICARNGSRHLVGKNALVDETNVNITFGAFTTIFRSKINPFLFYYFASSQFQYQSTGFLTTTINQLTNGNLNSILATLPPLLEQQAIAAFLDRETGRIDALITKKQRLLELLAEQRTALISRAVTKGLDASVKLKPSGVEWLGEVPEHWGSLPLRRVVETVKTGGTPTGAEESAFDDEGFNWYSPSDFSDQIILGKSNRALSEDGKKEVRIFPPKTVMIVGIGATIGKVGLTTYESSCNQQINAIILGKRMKSEFATYYLKTMRDFIVKCGKYTTLPIINQDETKNLIFTLPPLPEQQAIAAFLDCETAKIDTLSGKVTTVIERLKEYRTALISSVVTGKIDVRENNE